VVAVQSGRNQDGFRYTLELVASKHSVGEIMNAVFEEHFKKLLIQPTVVTEHPVVRRGATVLPACSG